jgi:hypothetical protein
MKENNSSDYCHIKHVHIYLYCSITDRLRNTLRKREKVGLVRNTVQLSRANTHIHDRIILFIAIFGKEQKGNERKEKNRRLPELILRILFNGLQRKCVSVP